MRAKRLLIAAITVALPLGIASAVFESPAYAAAKGPSCMKAYAPPSVPQVSEVPSQAIGQMGILPPAQGRPSWDGRDRTNVLLYHPRLDSVFAFGVLPSYSWGGNTYPLHNVVELDAKTGQPTGFAPNVDGPILAAAFTCDGNSVIIGGSFHHVNGHTRNYLAKISLVTGKVSSWNPDPNGRIEGISVTHYGHIVVGGTFTSIGGAPRTQVASITSTGKAGAWFHPVLTGHEPEGPQKVRILQANHRGTALVMTGNFNQVNGQPHRRIALFRLTDKKAILAPWHSPLFAAHNNSNSGTDCSRGYPAPEQGAAFTPDDTKFLLADTGAGHANTVCDTASEWDAGQLGNTNAKALAVQYTGGDSLSGIVATNSYAWTLGHNRWGNNPPLVPRVKVQPCSTVSPVNMGPGYAGYGCQGPHAKIRNGTMQLSLSTMKVTGWDPGDSKQVSMHASALLTPEGLWCGSDVNKYAGQTHNDIVLFPYG